jgi:hypothetical protein
MHTSFIVSIKAFGDFVIAASALRAVRKLPPDCRDLQLLAGEHLRQLAGALQLEAKVRFIPSGANYPGAFDVRGGGVLRAALSLWRLRRYFARLPRDWELIFDQAGWRERVLGTGHRHSSFLSAPNIYQAATATLRAAGYQLEERPGYPVVEGAGARGTVAIFASSRVAHKAIPPNVIGRVVKQLDRAGLRPEVIALAGETLNVPADAPVRRIDRNFGAVITAISGCALVVSADSVPAHLAEYLGVPTYVLSPAPNEYWLPLSSFLTRGWSLFSDDEAMPAWLANTLTQ